MTASAPDSARVLRTVGTFLAKTRTRILRDPIWGSDSCLAMCVAPGMCLAGEIVYVPGGGVDCAWLDHILYKRYDELVEPLRRLSRRRLLAGRPVALALCTSQVYAWDGPYEEEKPLDEQHVLPGAPAPDQLECGRCTQGDVSLNACMRCSDVHLWSRILDAAGLIPGVFAPSGPGLPELAEVSTETTLKLPGGTLIYCFRDSGWEMTIHVPLQPVAEPTQPLSFSAEPLPPYAHLSVGGLLCVEAARSARLRPELSCNPNTYRAVETQRSQARYWRILRRACALAAAAVALVTVGTGLLAATRSILDRLHAPDRAEIAAARELREQNDRLRRSLSGHEECLAMRGNSAVVLAAAAAAVCDSLWFSELRYTDADGRRIEIIGHAYGERMVSAFMAALQGNEHIVQVTLDYAERLSVNEVARLTGWRRKLPLVRYRVTLALS